MKQDFSKRLLEALAAAALAICLLFGGTRTKNAADILREADAGLKTASDLTADTALTLSLTKDTDQYSIEANSNLTVISSAPSAYASTVITASRLDNTAKLDLETYVIGSDKEYDLYMGYGGQWYKTPLQSSPVYLSVQDMSVFVNNASDFQIDKTITSDADGAPCYALNGTVSLSQLMSAFDAEGINPIAAMLGNADYSAVEAPVSILINKATSLPESVSINIAPAISGQSDSIEAEDCSFTIYYRSFNTGAAVVVSETAAEKSASADTDTLARGMLKALGIIKEQKPAEPGETPVLTRAAQLLSLGDTWDTYTIQIKDKVITLPCDYDDMKKTGLTLDTEDTPEDTLINGYDTKYMFFLNADTGGGIMVQFFNPYSTPKALNTCLITEIIAQSRAKDTGIDITIPGGFTLGNTRDSLVAAYGDPFRVKDTTSYTKLGWTINNSFYQSIEVSVDITTGTIEEIDLCKRE